MYPFMSFHPVIKPAKEKDDMHQAIELIIHGAISYHHQNYNHQKSFSS